MIKNEKINFEEYHFIKYTGINKWGMKDFYAENEVKYNEIPISAFGCDWLVCFSPLYDNNVKLWIQFKK